MRQRWRWLNFSSQLKASGYKIVQVRTKEPVATLAAYDQQRRTRWRMANMSAISSVIRTIGHSQFSDRFSATR
jgi:hypothetical protein